MTTSTQGAPGKDQDGAKARPASTGPGGRAARNHLAVARGAGMVVIRVVGSGNMIVAPALNDFLEEERASGYRLFIFDLQQCRGLDSTFMGCMVGLCTTLQREAASALEFGVRRSLLESVEAPGSGPELEAQRNAWASGSIQTTGQAASKDETVQEMSREDALAELKVRFGEEPDGSDPRQAGAKRGFVLAVNVSAECRELMNILGVDKFVKVHGDVDLAGLEVAPLPERNLPPLERRRLILEAHEHLVEIDKRNEAQFGAFLKSLSNELAKEGIR